VARKRSGHPGQGDMWFSWPMHEVPCWTKFG
jgi:hypothetical protein